MVTDENALTQPKFDVGIREGLNKYKLFSWGYVDFKMAANENALTQPKFDLGIFGIIQNVFQGDYTTKQKFQKLLEKN